MATIRLAQHLPLDDERIQVLIALFAGIGLGLASVVISPVLGLAIPLVGLATALAMKRPEFVVISILVAFSSIFPVEWLPLVPIGIGSLNIIDIALLGMFAVIFLRWMIESHFHFISTPYDVLLSVFCGLAFFSTFLAMANHTVVFREAVRDIRYVFYYMTFFALTNLLHKRHQLLQVWWGMMILAGITVGAMLLQYTFGESIKILPGRVETLTVSGQEVQGITRLRQPGETLVLVMFTVAITTFVLRGMRARLANFLFLNMLGVGVLLTFNRQYWINVAISIGILLYLLRKQDIDRFLTLGIGAVFMIVLIFFYGAIQPNSEIAQVMQASIARLASLSDEDYEGAEAANSLGFRAIENSYAIPQLSPPPLIGNGWGSKYRPYTELDWEGYDGRGYLHNSHFGLMLRSGFIAYAAFALISVLFMVRGLRYWRFIPDPRLQAMMLGFTIAYPGILIGATVNPMLTDLASIPVISIMIGFNEVLIQKYALPNSGISQES